MKMISGHGMSGPFKNEQDFKMAWIRSCTERALPGTRFFCVETEETEPGFPDVMTLSFKQTAKFFEMKLADAKDNFTLQPTQPLFYRGHTDMNISIMVWSNKRNKLYKINASEIITRVLGNVKLTLNLSDFKEE